MPVQFHTACLLTASLVGIHAVEAVATLEPATPARRGEMDERLDPNETVDQLLERCIEDDLTSARVLGLSASLGDHVIDLLFERLAERSRRASTVLAFDRSMAEVPQIALKMEVRRTDPGARSYRAAGLRVLARRGTQRDLGTVFALSDSHTGAPASSATLDALEVALVGIFERYPLNITDTRGHLSKLDQAQMVRLIRALGQHGQDGRYGSERTFQVLADLLAEDAIYRSMILAQIGRLAPPAARTGAMNRVQALLGSPDAAIRREATLTVGKLEDIESFGTLIDLLEHEDERLRSTAHWSLKRISGRTFSAGARQWRAWHAAENAWWADRAPELFDLLHGDDAGDVAAALNELATHRLFRHGIAEALSPLLASPHNETVLLSCSAAYSLRSPAALPGLIECLDHPDERIQISALRGLTAITGIDLPRQADSWHQALGL
ncbi:MAG: hypothetical protein ACI8QZ_001077 [Chlamydiales bacterium]|jgi:hypothetical protein